MKKLLILMLLITGSGFSQERIQEPAQEQETQRNLKNLNNDKYMEKYNYHNNNETIVCESIRNRRSQCRADTRFGVNFIQQLSSSSCDYNWGYDNQGIWVDNGCRAEFSINRGWDQPGAEDNIMLCESHRYKQNYCSANLEGRDVYLLTQLSNSSCLNNWGYDRNGVWVTNGCRAEFVVEDRYSNIDDVVVCSSRDLRFQGCPADTRGGVDFIRQISRASCNGNWGYDNQGIWVTNGCRAKFRILPYVPVNTGYNNQDTVKCSSRNRQRNVCRADTSGGVRLQKQHSNASCRGNWGYTRNQIWVDNGCRATFQLYVDGYGNQGYGNNNGYGNQGHGNHNGYGNNNHQPEQPRTLICSSRNSRRNTCDIPNGSKVQLLRQLSRSSCEGQWGYNRNKLWVDNGCRAEFSIF